MPSSKLRQGRRILAIRLDNIGDVIMLSPAVRALKRDISLASLTLLSSPAGAQAATLLPWVDEVIPWRASWQEISEKTEDRVDQELELVERLKAGRFDAAFIFTSFSQSPYPAAYACLLAGIQQRVGQTREFGGTLLTHWVKPAPDHGYQVDRNIHLLRSAGIPVSDDRIELRIPDGASAEVDILLQDSDLSLAEPFIVLAPGASAATRRYNPERFLRAAALVASETGWPVILVGTSRDLNFIPANYLDRTGPSPRVRSLIGKTSLPQMAEIIRRANLVLANNSAAIHIAEAFLRPVVALYAGTDVIAQWAPRYTAKRILTREVPCSPCYGFSCPYQHECLEIPFEEVAVAALDLINEQPTSIQANRIQVNLEVKHESTR